MILTGAMVFLLLAVYGACVVYGIAALGLSFAQARLYAPLKLLYRIDDKAVRDARRADAPVIYVVTHQSRLDPALMLSLLPEDTLHILDAYSAGSAWLEPFRGLARTIAFNAQHVFVSRRLVRVLKGKGRIAVYLPDMVEPDTRSLRLYRAVSRIAMQADAAIVPLVIDGSRSLPFSLVAEPDAPRRLLPRLAITTLSPMSIPEILARAGTAAGSMSNALFDRVAEARVAASTRAPGLFLAIRDASTRFGPDTPIIDDSVSGSMTYRQLLVAARVLAGRFARATAPGEVVGVMLPNTIAVAASLIGLMSAGRTPAILNYTSGPANVASAIRTTMVRTLISSRVFVQKAKLTEEVRAAEDAGAKILWIEDVRQSVSTFDKAVAALFWRAPVARQEPDAPAAILFTSGSEGLPKAIVLSHRNLLSNAMQVEARVAIGARDRLMNVLPVFHSFGLTGGLFLPLLSGVRVLLYPSPLHYKLIPRAAATFRPTVLIGTDTFLAAYGHAAGDADFESVRFAVAGAEAVRASTRQMWAERFGVRILEGFGMTEASPVVAVNTASHGRDGTVGRLLPGMRARLEPVEGITEAGRLWVSGPNVMMGAMTADQPGVLQPLASGWHDSGDIVSIDRDGFLTVRGRARRFAKIAGEMISLGAVEALAGALWPEGRHAAITLPDPRRGERIVLVTTTAEADAASLRRHAKASGATELMLPEAIVRIDAIPALATGKIDYRAVLRMAVEKLGDAAAAA